MKTTRRHILMNLYWYHPKLHLGIARYAKEHNWHLNDHSATYSGYPNGWQGDGVICTNSESPKYLDFLESIDAPKVGIGSGSKSVGFPIVYSNDKLIAEMAIDHFKERGIRRFAMFWMFGDQGGRLPQFSQQLAEQGITCLSWHSKNWNALKDVMNTVREELALDQDPIGVLAFNDEIAVSFIEACVDAGLRIPEQLSVLGISNDFIRNELSAIPISSVEHRLHEIGYQAASALDRQIDGDTSVPKITLVDPIGIVARKSTDIMIESNLRLRQALEFMRQHFSDPLSNDDIARAAGSSTRNLFELFGRRIGRSPGKELERIRVEHAKSMLTNTDEKLYTVAAESGLSSANNLHKVFRRVIGMTPRDYRKKHSRRWIPPTYEW